jgi:hypothetical protein
MFKTTGTFSFRTPQETNLPVVVVSVSNMTNPLAGLERTVGKDMLHKVCEEKQKKNMFVTPSPKEDFYRRLSDGMSPTSFNFLKNLSLLLLLLLLWLVVVGCWHTVDTNIQYFVRGRWWDRL